MRESSFAISIHSFRMAGVLLSQNWWAKPTLLSQPHQQTGQAHPVHDFITSNKRVDFLTGEESYLVNLSRFALTDVAQAVRNKKVKRLIRHPDRRMIAVQRLEPRRRMSGLFEQFAGGGVGGGF